MSCDKGTKAILICPYWPSATFCPLIIETNGTFKYVITDFIVSYDPTHIIKQGNNKKVVYRLYRI